jgi:hypothetical protein
LTIEFTLFNNLNELFPILVTNLAAIKRGDTVDPNFVTLFDFVKRNKKNFKEKDVRDAFTKKLDLLLSGSMEALISQ